MTEQTTLWLFYAVFSCQVLLISFFLPRRVLQQLKFLVQSYPPTEYPRLYPVSMDRVEQAQRNYRGLNLLALAVGLGLVVVGLGRPGSIDWDNELIQIAYQVLQFSPFAIALSAGFVYFNLKREVDSRTTRRAELHPRRLFDYVSRWEIGLAGAVYLTFVWLVLYVRQFEFPWFGGYLNIVMVTAINLSFAAIVFNNLHGKKKDPYQTHEDRGRQLEAVIRSMAWTSILLTLFVALFIALSAFDLNHLKPVTFSLYIQVLALLSFRSFRINNVNFEVYREDAAAA